jgi:succinyl-CoA synthetase beta subunit
VKVQVQVGGRGKGGGVALCRSAGEARDAAARMLGSDFKGHAVTRVLVEELLPIAHEFYTSVLLDRSVGEYLWMLTAEGGMDIETLARERPEALRRVHVNPGLGLRAWHLRELVGVLPVDARDGASQVLRAMWSVVQEADATLVEINPLVQLEGGEVVALDAKVTVDDNALFRHPDLEALQNAFPVDPVEKRAKDADLQYVKLDGSVGIIGNGAGLVMSTLDVVAQAGGRAANFLDIGGGASAEKMATSLQVILSDPSVRCVFINIFGGITRCDVVAEGILEALKQVEPTVPIVVRLDGTNAEEGRRILAEAAHPRIVPVATMDAAAEEAARLAGAA